HFLRVFPNVIILDRSLKEENQTLVLGSALVVNCEGIDCINRALIYVCWQPSSELRNVTCYTHLEGSRNNATCIGHYCYES
ncbi:hypothetical protein PMAYCL1PPCAC_21774, partial [Pristionchus mayeri]